MLFPGIHIQIVFAVEVRTLMLVEATYASDNAS